MERLLDRRNFGSLVARRVFVLFLACALVPVGVLGAFSWIRSSQELETSAREQLRLDSKREGMAILSRLLVADAVLARTDPSELVAREPRASSPISEPFRAVAIVDAKHTPGGPITHAEARALRRGGAALRSVPGQRLFMLRLAAGEPGAERVVAAEIDPAYLWTFDANEPDTSLTVAEEDGTLLFSSFSKRLATGESRGPTEEVTGSWVLFIGGHFAAKNWHVVRGEPLEATLAPLAEFRRVFGWSALLALFVVAALSSIQIRRTLGPLQRLAATTVSIGEGDLGARAGIVSNDEFGALGAAFDAMAARIQRNLHGFESANELGLALSHEPNEKRLTSLFLKAVMGATHCRSAAFLRLGEGGAVLVEGIAGSWEGTSPAVDEAIEQRREVHVEGANAQLVLPIVDHHQRLLGVVQLCEPRNDDGSPLPRFRSAELSAARSLAAQAAIAFTNRVLVDEFRTLFEGLIELTITALDAKSAHTAGHCRRVPILAEMLADALCETREGRFARFTFTTAERYELRISALLHDFGKIVTPVHVMDKSTKLETIHDRIELVATRYAVLARDAEIAWLRERLARAGEAPSEWQGGADLAEELAFLRAHNRGGEGLQPEVRDRIHAIARSRAWRTLDGARAPVLSAEEVENLTIARGTLTERERKVIEEHADYTIRLLERLPFPPHLQGVPQIAGSHHERVSGGGYPLGLRGEQITLQGRLLGIADVFEALTAPDRPYREPMTVSAAVDQLREMTKSGHLDHDIFELFIREGVHLRYARDYLRPEQLDDATLEALARIPGGPLPH